MTWMVDEVVQALERTFPNLSVIIADGEVDYLVGAIEDSEGSIIASFQLLMNADGKTVSEIRLAEGQTYFRLGEPSSQREKASYVVPIQTSQRDEIGEVWGLVGDHEV